DKFGEMGKVAIFGDLKQAIYRFRNGDPELLKQLSQPETFSKALKSNVLNSSQVNNVHLDTNYRSTPSIIQFNNKFFDYWVQSGGMQELKEYYSEVEQKTNQNKDPGLVSIQFKTEDDERDNTSYLIEETLQTILQLKKEGVPFGDIAVLMSGNSTLSDLGLLLSKNEIPIISSESLTLSSSTWVMLLSSAVEWIANPDLPYYRMMVAHYFLRSNDQTADNLYDVIQNHDSFLGFLNNRGVTIHPDQLRMMHLNRIIYELLKTFKISKRDPYIVAFLDEVEQHFSSGTGSLFEFITWWTENKLELKLSSSTSVDAVTLSTIHKAKGLAYKVVIFAFSQYGYQYTKKDQWIPTDSDLTLLPYSWVTLKEATLPDQYID
ncbi:MAG TPA: 3'-5' exonuclease, partial [Bacteroidales bacterium]|nr:3'-5' exonuclease [Bacteroidales bacterium]